MAVTEAENIVIGLIFALVAFTCIVAYIPCLIVIFRDKELISQSCYTMMLALGWIEVCACLLHLYVGIGCITGFFYIMPCKWNRLGGAFMEFFGWHYYTTAAAVLSFNRCLTIVAPTVAERMFSTKKTICWISGSYIYAGMWFVLFNSPYAGFVFHPELYTWEFEGTITTSLGNITIKQIGNIQNFVNFTPTCLCYLIICIAIVYKRMKFSAPGSPSMSKREKRLFIQLAIACIYPVIFNEYWISLHYVITATLGIRDEYANAFANFLWITVNGLNPFLYLTLNETIRRKVWAMRILPNCSTRVSTVPSNLASGNRPQ